MENIGIDKAVENNRGKTKPAKRENVKRQKKITENKADI